MAGGNSGVFRIEKEMPDILSSIRLSRWGKSTYEREEDIRQERELLSKRVTIVEDYSDAEIIVVHSKCPFSARELDKTPSA